MCSASDRFMKFVYLHVLYDVKLFANSLIYIYYLRIKNIICQENMNIIVIRSYFCNLIRGIVYH